MTVPERDDGNAAFKRALRRMFITIAIALVVTFAIIFYLWEHGPKPP